MRAFLKVAAAWLTASGCAGSAPSDPTLDLVHTGERLANSETTAIAVLTTTIRGAGEPLGVTTEPLLRPAGCATSQSDGVVTTFTFTDCAAPFGIRASVSGSVTATVRAQGEILDVDYASDDFHVGKAHLSKWRVSTHTTVAQDGSRRMLRTAHIEGSIAVAGGEQPFTRDVGPTNVAWGGVDACLGVDGASVASTTDAPNGAAVTTRLMAIRRCSSECPTAGGVVHISRADGASASISFLGGTSAQYKTAEGLVVRYAPTCEP